LADCWSASGVVFLSVPRVGAAALAPVGGSNGHAVVAAAARSAGGNGSTKSPVAVDGHLSVKQALQTLVN